MAATSAVLGRRTCAVLAAGSAGLHAVMLGHAANIAMGVLMAGMIVACLYCARDLWRRGTPGVWCLVALMNLAMIAVHLPAPSHHHVAGAMGVGQVSSIMALATAISAIEATLAIAVLWFRTRRRAELISGTPAH
jgi:NADH:ubiquinone oxidoreductase subunit K